MSSLLGTGNTDWISFLRFLEEYLSRGGSLASLDGLLHGQSVTWRGELKEKDFEEQRSGLPSVLLDMGDCVAKIGSVVYKADILRLYFDATSALLTPWWHVPLGTDIAFHAILSRKNSRACIDFRYGGLNVYTQNNARLLEPVEFALMTSETLEMIKSLHRTLTLKGEWPLPTYNPWDTIIGSLEWSEAAINGLSVFKAGMRAAAAPTIAVGEFWHRVISFYLQGSDYRLIVTVGMPEHLSLVVDFRSEDLSTALPARFVFDPGVLGSALLGEPGFESYADEALTFFKDFWRIVHIGLCNAASTLSLVLARPTTRALACESGQSSFWEMQLPR